MTTFYDQINDLINLLVHDSDKGWLWKSKPIKDSFGSIYKDFYKVDSDRLNHNKEYLFDKLIDESVEKLFPHLQEFNENKFWIISEDPKIKLNTDQLLVEKNSQKLIIGKGDYLKGGSFQDKYSTNNRLTVPSETSTSKLKAKKFVYLINPTKSFNPTKAFDPTKPEENLEIGVESANTVYINEKPIIRFYFNLRPNKEGILAWSQFLSSQLDSFGIPFRFKYRENLKDYIFCDSGVLYIAQNNFNIVTNIIKEVYGIFKANKQYDILRDEVPKFTRQIYDGIGFAEDPFFTEQSFGEQRCNLLIEIIDSQSSISDKKVLLKNVTDILVDKGYSVDEFYRNPQSNYKYDWDKFVSEFPNDRYPFTFHKTNLPQWANKERLKYLKIAQKYANELCQKAIWLSPNCCTWITYDYDKNNGFHRLLYNDEKRIIRYFLFKVGDFSVEKNYYKNLAEASRCQEFNRDKNIKFEADNSLNEFDTEEFNKNSFYNHMYTEALNSLDTNLMNTTPIDLTESQALIIGDSILEKYENIGLPLRNQFGTYDYTPTLKGSLWTGLFFLLLYKPRAFTHNLKFKDIQVETSSER